MWLVAVILPSTGLRFSDSAIFEWRLLLSEKESHDQQAHRTTHTTREAPSSPPASASSVTGEPSLIQQTLGKHACHSPLDPTPWTHEHKYTSCTGSSPTTQGLSSR